MAKRGKEGLTVREPGRDVPILYDADVAIAGAGTAGVFTAIAAARMGADTVLVDRFGSPGGNLGPGMVAGGSYRPMVGGLKNPIPRGIRGGPFGIPKEFLERYAAAGGGAIPPYKNNLYMRDAGAATQVLFEMLDEAGVHMVLSAYAADPLYDEDGFHGLFVENKSGRQAIRAKVTVDDTGEADLVRRAGLPVIQPRPEYHELDKHAPNGMGLWAVFGGIDCERYEREQAEPVDIEIRDIGELGRISTKPGLNIQFSGQSKYFDRETGIAGMRVQALRPVGSYDPGNGSHISEMEKRLRMYVCDVAQYFRKNVPGFEKAYVLTVSPFLGTRGGPCIEGEYTLTAEDCRTSRRFDDVIYIYGEGQAQTYVKERTGGQAWVDVPFRVMIPRGENGILAVGRSASCIPDTLLRQRLSVMHMGQAGGIAAAMAARQNRSPRDLDIRELQGSLLDAGFYLGNRSRLKELSLA